MSERTVADDTLTPGASTTCWEPTGCAELMYSETTALRMAALRESRTPAAGSVVAPRMSSVVLIVVGTPLFDRRPPRGRCGPCQVRRWHSTLLSADAARAAIRAGTSGQDRPSTWSRPSRAAGGPRGQADATYIRRVIAG